MAKSINVIYDRLSKRIFQKPFQGLPETSQKCFIARHYRWFCYYREKVALHAGKAMNKKLDGKDYEIIFDWYLKQIPAHVVKNAIDECNRYAKQHSKSIYSLNYFCPAVIRHLETHKRESEFYREVVESDDAWHYRSYCAWEKSEIDRGYYKRFHPFYGPNVHYGVSR